MRMLSILSIARSAGREAGYVSKRARGRRR
jgi:hypothetical protein